MRFKIYVDRWETKRVCIYDSMAPENTQLIHNPVLETELNKAGSLTYTIDANPLDSLALRIPIFTTIYIVEMDGKEIWWGRSISDDIDMYGTHTITCEGALAFLNDIMVRPYEYKEDVSPETLFKLYMKEYEDRASGYRMIHTGQVVVPASMAQKIEDKGTTSIAYLKPVVEAVIRGEYKNWPEREALLTQAGYDYKTVQNLVNRTLWNQPIDWGQSVTISETPAVEKVRKEMPGSVLSELVENLVNVYGGYLRIRWTTNGALYLDYIIDYGSIDDWPIMFGKNMLDYNETVDVSSVYTQVLPYGKADEDGKKLIIKDGVGDKSSVDSFGVIERAVEYNDIEDKEYLKSMALQDLDGSTFGSSPITVRAIDLAAFYTGKKAIQVGYPVQVESNIHSMKGRFICTNVTYDMDSPENTEYTFGNDVESFTDQVIAGSITNGIAVVRNGGSSMYNGGYLTDTIRANYAYIQQLEARSIKVDNLQAATAYIGQLEAASVTAQELMATNAYIHDLEAVNVTADILTANSIFTNSLRATNVTTDQLSAAAGYVATLTSGSGTFGSLTADTLKAKIAEIGQLDSDYAEVNRLLANKADITSLSSTNADLATLTSRVASIEDASIDTAKINELVANYLETIGLDATYAKIDAANIQNAFLEKIFVASGILSSGTVSNLQVTGQLGAVQIDASKITTGELIADRIAVMGSDGLYHRLNVDGGIAVPTDDDELAEYNSKLHGSNIIAESITATQIAASTITADELAANSVTTAKIATGAVTANEIAAGAVTAVKMSVDDLSAVAAKIAGIVLGSTSMHSENKNGVSDGVTGFYMGQDGSFSVEGNNGDHIRLNATTGELDISSSSFSSTVINTMSEEYLSKSEAEENYATISSLVQTNTDLSFTVNEISNILDSSTNTLTANENALRDSINTLSSKLDAFSTWFRFDSSGLSIGKSDSTLVSNMSNAEFKFVSNGQTVASFSGAKKLLEVPAINVGTYRIENSGAIFRITYNG